MKRLAVRTHVVHLVWPLLAAVAAAGCGGSTSPRSDGKVPVAVSVAPQAWLVEQIGGPHVDVVTIVRPGESPATYQPTDAEISRVMQASVFFRLGVPFENGGWFEAIQDSEQLKIVDLRKGIDLRTIERHVHHEAEPAEDSHDHAGHDHAQCEHCVHHEDGTDPHIWLSPLLLRTQARTIAGELANLAPQHKETFFENVTALEERLVETEAKLHEKLQPLRGKAIFVFHPAWGYFTDEFGLKQVAIELEGKEPSDRELTELQQAARESGTKVIFVQPQISSKSAEAVAQAIGGRVETIDPLAPDVPANLLRAADALVESYQ